MQAPSLTWCPSTHSLVGRNKDSSYLLILPLRCKRWTCSYCRDVNEIKLSEKVLAGKPNRMLTLTGKPLPGDTPLSMHKRLRPKVARLYQHIRASHPTWQAATFLELHRSSFPHYHALVRSNYVPIGEIRTRWQQLTGNFIVDMRVITDSKIALRYVSKYVTKQAGNPLLSQMGPRVTFTRGYLLGDKSDPPAQDLLWERDERHPHEIAQQLTASYDVVYQDRTVTAELRTKHPNVCSVSRGLDDFEEIEVQPV